MHGIETHRLALSLKPEAHDARGASAAAELRAWLAERAIEGAGGLDARTSELLVFHTSMDAAERGRVARELTDPVIQLGTWGREDPAGPFDWLIVVGFRPGVTDNVGRTAEAALRDILGRALSAGESVHTSTAYWLSDCGAAALDAATLEAAAADLLANPLIQTIHVFARAEWAAHPEAADWSTGGPGIALPRIDAETRPQVVRIDLGGADADLLRISREGTLSLSLAEMHAIRDHFAAEARTDARRAAGLDARPTDAELEMIAQTWSEHCKHKIFAARIEYTDEDGRTETIDSLFKTCIRGATERVAREIDWLVSVFHDNAGVIAFNERLDVVYKVETHNSPSALEPYGGAMTGIVGCNRDPLGTGLGAELLINVWGYCFASPFTPREAVPAGALHPRRLRAGVHQGVIDGGNQSGIPYGLGWEYFDPRFLAKPLVYCGTVGLLPKRVPDGRPAAEKEARPGDAIFMVGGRIGKDGIHGATFSSEELHKDSPVQAVQIGDPITQKKMSDFLLEARDAGLYRAITDNGAGGLSSSIGEMAEGPGGARVDLAAAPLKYPGLQPWEIWLSEAQERMTLAVPPEHAAALRELARRRDVELAELGAFDDSGYIELRYGEELVGRIAIEFLHNGCPRLELTARWSPPTFAPVPRARAAELDADLAELMTRLNLAAKEERMRRYDHEVKARTVVKPLIGKRRDTPADATVFLAEYAPDAAGAREGIVLSCALHSHLSDLDTHAMAMWTLDLAVRRIVAAGGRLDRIAALDNFCWPDPVESESAPDGAYKLAQLVRACRGLHDACVACGVPLISGKDSMKNDSTRGGRRISIPPSLLISAIGRIDDVRRARTLEPKDLGDIVYVLGTTRPELGGSEYGFMRSERVLGPRDQLDPAMTIGGAVPRVDCAANLALYRAVEAATTAGELRSLHAVGLGGLAAAFATMGMAAEMGLALDLTKLPNDGCVEDAELLFAESAGRFVVTVPPAHAEAFEARMGELPHAAVGLLMARPRLLIHGLDGRIVVDRDLLELKAAWRAVLADV